MDNRRIIEITKAFKDRLQHEINDNVQHSEDMKGWLWKTLIMAEVAHRSFVLEIKIEASEKPYFDGYTAVARHFRDWGMDWVADNYSGISDYIRRHYWPGDDTKRFVTNNHPARKSRALVKISIALNIVFICGTIFLAAFLVRKNYFNPRPSHPDLQYAGNPNYENYTTLYPLYHEHKNVVMLGNSLTAYASWTELLNRPDVATRGVAGDITAGFLARLDNVINLKPKIVFIEGGVNDLSQGIAQDTIIKNMTSVIETLQKNNIKPVLTTVTLLAKQYTPGNPVDENRKIKALNERLLNLAKAKNIRLIDLNQYVSDTSFLMPGYAVKDGIHFTGKTYETWKREVEQVLEQEKI